MSYYVINGAGIKEVTNFINVLGKSQILDYYISYAENSANNNFDIGFDATIEIDHFSSINKFNHTLILDKTWFDKIDE